jgi:hypothetical protein
MKKDDPDRHCFCSEEFYKKEDWESRIEHGSWYRRVTACRNYSKNRRADNHTCKKWGHKGGPCGKKEDWNDYKAIAKYREGAKEPYNIEPSFKLNLNRVLSGQRVLSGKHSI